MSCHVKFLQSYNQSVTPLRVLDFTINSPVNYRNNIIMHMWETLAHACAQTDQPCAQAWTNFSAERLNTAKLHLKKLGVSDNQAAVTCSLSMFWHFNRGVTPRVKCHFFVNLRVIALRAQTASRRFIWCCAVYTAFGRIVGSGDCGFGWDEPPSTS